MFSVRSIFAIFCVLILALSTINAAPNRVLMRFGKRGGNSEGHLGYRFVPAGAPAIAEYIDVDDVIGGDDRF
ncbi:FMRF-Like Peptide [Caenorhabditis elegans]|uniref:FMRF-Like Peptide n=1 Tax=Caenorhabditis elegans TaxID=6239 RepID=Q7YWT6_CAEEL|nr:FMRF-Like Peptide [Caenorhabditis elegans]CAE17946.1 FMRF-Like Peptide [Caenorhabditis elegans]|eukprot:NP_001024947.1 FMRF-Like Peptide [Caenorhabditis elegans]